MSVLHAPCFANGRERIQDEIEILIPGECARLRATYRDCDGHVQTAQVSAPRVSVIPPRERYVMESQGSCDMVRIALDPTFFDRKAAGSEPRSASSMHAHYAAIDPFLRKIGNALRSDLMMHRFFGTTYLQSLAQVIARHLAARYTGDECAAKPRGTLESAKLERVLEFMARHLAERVTVAKLAEAVHMSAYHFARTFKASMGEPPHVYLTARRVELAKQLLEGTDTPLVDVAADAGFQTQSHFTGVFHRYTGTTPRAFRLSVRMEPAAAFHGRPLR